MHFLDHDGAHLAYRHRPGDGPTVVFLPGYMSNMGGTKAEALDGWAATRGRAFLRLDYSGCGASGGDFADGTITRWTADARAVIATVAPGPVVLVGSSMGAWIALRLALDLGDRVAALVTLAGAPDFTAWGLDLTAADDGALVRDGFVERPSRYGAPYRYHAGLIADGTAHPMLGGSIEIRCPARLIHGQDDPDVPWRLSLEVTAALLSTDVQVILVKDGDHRLSRTADLELLSATLDGLVTRARL